MVIDVSRKFIPEMASGFNNEKLTLHISDGFKFLEEHSVQYDVIIADISDPEGMSNCSVLLLVISHQGRNCFLLGHLPYFLII